MDADHLTQTAAVGLAHLFYPIFLSQRDIPLAGRMPAGQ
jgi:hypothetical protein